MNKTLLPIIETALAETVKRQSFFQRWAGTIVPIIAALGAGLGGFAAAAASGGTSDEKMAIVGVIAAVVTGIAARLTPNGNTPTTQARSAKEIEKALDSLGSIRVDDPSTIADAVTDVAKALPTLDAYRKTLGG